MIHFIRIIIVEDGSDVVIILIVIYKVQRIVLRIHIAVVVIAKIIKTCDSIRVIVIHQRLRINVL